MPRLKAEGKRLTKIVGESFLKSSYLFPRNASNRRILSHRHVIRVFSQKKGIEIRGFSGNVHLRSKTRTTLLPLVVTVEKHVNPNRVPGKMVLSVEPTSVGAVARTVVFSHPVAVGWGADQ